MLIRFLDKTLVCQDCGKEFIWSAGEQEFYAVIGLDNEPKRCPSCRKARRYGWRKPWKEHEVVCAACGEKTTVPFLPKEGRPVYCRDCYEALGMVAKEA